MDDLDAERQRSRELLLNVLPARIVARLDAGETHIADRHEHVAVLMTDLVGFTAERRAALAPPSWSSELNELFTQFDEACAARGVEKIKTIGDAYMAVAGLDATATATAASRWPRRPTLRSTCSTRCKQPGARWQMRIGIHAGPVVAGVIGTRKFAYDVWGDTVNVASRLESTSLPGRIQVSQAGRGRARPAASTSNRAGSSSSRARATCRRGSSSAGAEARGSKLPVSGPGRLFQPTRLTRRSIAAGARRPSAEIIAQDAVVETLRNAVRLDRLSHGLLFVGPRGTGKTSTARIVAKAVNCPNAVDGEPDDTANRASPSARAARSTSSSSTRLATTASTTCASCCRASTRRAGGPEAQGLHHRRGPAHQGRLGRPAQDARGAAAGRAVHLLHDRSVADPAGGRLAPPALHVPAAARDADPRQAAPHRGGRRPLRHRRRARPDRAARRRRHARRRVDARPGASRAASSRSTPTRSATCSAWPISRRSIASSPPWPAAMRSTASGCSTSSKRDGRDLVAFADQVVARLREQLVADSLAGQSVGRSIRRACPRRPAPGRARHQPRRRRRLPTPARAGAPGASTDSPADAPDRPAPTARPAASQPAAAEPAAQSPRPPKAAADRSPSAGRDAAAAESSQPAESKPEPKPAPPVASKPAPDSSAAQSARVGRRTCADAARGVAGASSRGSAATRPTSR